MREYRSVATAIVVVAAMSGVTALKIQAADEEKLSRQPPSGKPLAWARFTEGPETYRDIPYWWLGKYDLSCEINVEPEPHHALDFLWGSKNDLRTAIISVNGHQVRLQHGGYEGFRWVRLRLPDKLSGRQYKVRFRASSDNEAFLAAVRLTDTNVDENQSADLPETSRRLKVKTSPAESVPAPSDKTYADTHPIILRMWQSAKRGARTAPRVESARADAVYRWPRSAPGGPLPSFEYAGTSARIAGYSLDKVHRWLHEKALPHIDEETGLYRVRGNWDYSDTAADCYPFLAWAAWATDRDVLNGPVRRILRREQKLCNIKGALPAPYDFEAGKPRSISYEQRMFGASEYVKDGLIPIVEVTGKDAWFERMKEIEDAMWRRARVETEVGAIPSKDVEVNGEQLQVLPRLFRMTGDKKYLGWAQRLADYYLQDENFVPHRLRDHGCEIIGGLGLLVGIESEVAPERVRERLPRLRKMYDEILERGTNEDGMMYNTIEQNGGQLSDGWGYNYPGLLCWDMAAGRSRYRGHLAQTLQNLGKPEYSNYNWEGNHSIDGYADSIEGAIYCLNRVGVPEAAEWIDREAMKNLVPPAPLTLGDRELWDVMKLHANGVRTVIIHALMHTRGCLARPWQQGLELGASEKGGTLAVVLKSEKEWSGRLIFDIPRHSRYIGFERDWPRMNTLPEWFTVQPDREYRVKNVGTGEETVLTGRELHKGKKVTLAPGEKLQLMVAPSE